MNRKRRPNACGPLGLSTFTRMRLRAALFLAGTVVMALGLLGVRMVGPHFGQGLFVWTLLVSLAMLAQALGHALGGQLVDRRPSMLLYSGILLAAAAAVALILLTREPVLILAWKFGLRTGSLFAVTCLLFPPLLLLGMVSPFAVRLEAGSVEQSGRSAGLLHAVFMVGAVTGGMLAGFFLIPSFRVPTVLTILAGMLVLAGLLVMQPGFRKRLAGVGAAIVIIGVLLSRPKSKPPELLASSSYDGKDIRVVSYEGSRYLFSDQMVQTSVNSKGRSMEKPIYFIAARLLMARPETKSVVLIGLGGAGIVPLLTERAIDVECVDASPAALDLARTHLGLPLPPSKTRPEDGRFFLKSHAGHFDSVILDVFAGDRPAYPLVTLEGLRTAGAALKPGGLLALNTWGIDLERGEPNLTGASIHANLRQVFKHVLAVPAAGNLLLFASDEPIQARISSVLLPAFDVPRHFTWLAVAPITWPDVPTLTDDWNPVDVLDLSSLETTRSSLRDTLPDPVRRALAWE